MSSQSSNKWIKVNDSAVHDDNGPVDVTSAEHTGRVGRDGSVNVAYGGKTKVVTVTQEPKPPFVVFDRGAYDVAGTGGTLSITGRSNEPYLAFTVSPESAVTEMPQHFSITTVGGRVSSGNLVSGQVFSGDPGADNEFSFMLTLPIGRNTGDSERVTTVTCNGRTDSASTSIRQAGAGEPPAPPTEEYIRFANPTIVVSADEEECTLVVESNADWTLFVL